MIVKPPHALLGALLVAACGASPAKPDAPTGADDAGPGDGAPGDVPGHIPGMPGLGGWGLSFYKLDHTPLQATLSTPPVTTQSGSTIVVSVGRGDNTLLSIPTDNKGNTPYRQIDTMHAYSQYQNSGTALYAFPAAAGGAGFRVTTNAGKAVAGPIAGRADEVTMAAVEILEGSRIQDFSWVEDRTPPNTSGSVTTTGPATLIAFWWGDGFTQNPQSAVAGDGFHPVATNAEQVDSFVQCAVAYKNVPSAGTYNVTWTPQPDQGAQLWLVAVQ